MNLNLSPMQSRRQGFVIVFFTSWMTLSILKRGYPLEIPRALASFEVANTMSRVFWEWSKMILCFFSISYREVSFKFSLNKKEKDSGNLFSSNWTGFPVEEKRPCLLCHSKNKLMKNNSCT